MLRRLVQLVMSDEAFHHRFGRIWASRTISHLSEDEHKKVEDWAAQIFQTLLFNLINAEQKQVIYAKYGLDWQWVRDAMKEVFTDEDRRAGLKESTNIFRVLIKTLLHAGIITARTAPLYGVWVDMKELEAEGDGIPGDIVAEEMMVDAARDQRQAEADRLEGRGRSWQDSLSPDERKQPKARHRLARTASMRQSRYLPLSKTSIAEPPERASPRAP